MDTRRNEKKRKERGASPARKWRGVGRARARVSGPFASNLWNEEVQNAQKFLSLSFSHNCYYTDDAVLLCYRQLSPSIGGRHGRFVSWARWIYIGIGVNHRQKIDIYIYKSLLFFFLFVFFFFQNDARLPAALPRPHHSWMRVGSPALAMACLFGPFLLVRGWCM